jgi:hypothetical protein
MKSLTIRKLTLPALLGCAAYVGGLNFGTAIVKAQGNCNMGSVPCNNLSYVYHSCTIGCADVTGCPSSQYGQCCEYSEYRCIPDTGITYPVKTCYSNFCNPIYDAGI